MKVEIGRNNRVGHARPPEQCHNCGDVPDTLDIITIGDGITTREIVVCTGCRRELTNELDRRKCSQCIMKEKFDAGDPMAVMAVEKATEMFGGENDVLHSKCNVCRKDLCKRRERVVMGAHWRCIENERKK